MGLLIVYRIVCCCIFLVVPALVYPHRSKHKPGKLRALTSWLLKKWSKALLFVEKCFAALMPELLEVKDQAFG
jgi:hypothetical protein